MNYSENMLIHWENVYNKAKNDYKQSLKINTKEILQFTDPCLKNWIIKKRNELYNTHRNRIFFAAKQIKIYENRIKQKEETLKYIKSCYDKMKYKSI